MTITIEDETFAKLIAAELAKHLRPETMPDPLLTASETARRMGVSESTVRHLVTKGHLRRVAGLSELRIKQSAADSYGAEKPTK